MGPVFFVFGEAWAQVFLYLPPPFADNHSGMIGDDAMTSDANDDGRQDACDQVPAAGEQPVVNVELPQSERRRQNRRDVVDRRLGLDRRGTRPQHGTLAARLVGSHRAGRGA